MTSKPSAIRYLACFTYELLLLIALTLFASALFYSVFGSATLPPKKTILQVYLWLVMGAYFVYHWKKGATLAMSTWKLRIVGRDQTALTSQQAITRYLIASFLFGITCLWALFDREGLFLHDRIAGTRLLWQQNENNH